ncbi:hypothetical protein JCM17380_30200 [Desulfosporosinus burensis]
MEVNIRRAVNSDKETFIDFAVKLSEYKLHAYSWNNKARRLYEKNGFRDYAVSYEIFL